MARCQRCNGCESQWDMGNCGYCNYPGKDTREMNDIIVKENHVWTMTWTKASLIEYLKHCGDDSEIMFMCGKCRTYHQAPPIIKEVDSEDLEED